MQIFLNADNGVTITGQTAKGENASVQIPTDQTWERCLEGIAEAEDTFGLKLPSEMRRAIHEDYNK